MTHLRNVKSLLSPCWPVLVAGVVAVACGGTRRPAASAPDPVAPAPSPAGVVRAPGSFADNPIVYFVMTDRFVNGDPSNDHGYARAREAAAGDDIATVRSDRQQT